MGHAIDYFILKATNKDDALKEGYKIAQHFASVNVDREENPSGDYHGSIQYYNNIFDCEESAKEFFRRKGNYYDGIVRVRQASPSALKRADEKRRKLYSRVTQLKTDVLNNFRLRTSVTIACKNCGSRFLKEEWLRRGLYCPVCRNWAAPNSAKEKLAKLQADLNQVEEDLRKEQAQSSTLRYFLKVEVHT